MRNKSTLQIHIVTCSSVEVAEQGHPDFFSFTSIRTVGNINPTQAFMRKVSKRRKSRGCGWLCCFVERIIKNLQQHTV